LSHVTPATATLILANSRMVTSATLPACWVCGHPAPPSPCEARHALRQRHQTTGVWPCACR
jgi:hypothetical protein